MNDSNAPLDGDGIDDASSETGELVERSSGRRRLVLTAAFLAALLVGLIWQDRVASIVRRAIPDPNRGRRILYWRSPMDPSIRSDSPGKTPMGMDLVPVYADEGPPPQPVTVDPEIQEQEYTIAVVRHGPLVRSLSTIGTVTFAEPLVGDVTLKFEGWLDKLYADYEGQSIQRGDPLFEVYSPALIAAEEEFLIAQKFAKGDGTTRTLNAADNLRSARVKLRYLDMTDEQIDELAKQGTVQKTLTYHSPFSGIIVEKHAFAGTAIPGGKLLYRIADLSRVWINVFVYENQIHCVHEGQGATLTLSELPGRQFKGKVTFVYPYLDPKSRTAQVRLEFDNPDLALMPDMFGHIRLEPHKMGEGISIPRWAVMETGKRSLVYVVREDNRFEPREVRTGMELDDDYLEILSGLQPGERVVLNPDFLMDSESRIRLINRKFVRPPKLRDGSSRHQAMPGMSAHRNASSGKKGHGNHRTENSEQEPSP